MEKLILRRNEIQSALEGKDTEELGFHYVQEVLINLENIIKKMTNEEKKGFYQLIIEQVVIKNKKAQEIKLKIAEKLQEYIKNKILSDKDQLDRVIFVHKNQRGILIITI